MEKNYNLFSDDDERDWATWDISSINTGLLRQLEDSAYGDYNFVSGGSDMLVWHSRRNPYTSVYIFEYNYSAYYFVIENGELTGAMAGTFDDDVKSANGSKIYILPEYRRQGFLKDLLEAFISRNRGCNTITLDLSPKEILIKKGFEPLPLSDEEQQLELNKRIAESLGFKVSGTTARL